jgi:NDP-sugar pyrophosphorylase family protein
VVLWRENGAAEMKMLILAAGSGSRLRSETGGLPKQALMLAGRTLLDRLLELAGQLRLTPLVVTRPVYAPVFRQLARAEVLAVEETHHMLATLASARPAVQGDFLWVGGDTVFSDPAPLGALLASHLAERRYGSFLLRRSSRHLAKMRPGSPVPRVTLTREGEFPYSLPNFGIQRGASFDDLATEPRSEYVQRALDRGEPIAFEEYEPPLFEIDTPDDLAAARRFFTACSTS